MKYHQIVSVKKHCQLWLLMFVMFLQQSTMADIVMPPPHKLPTSQQVPDPLTSVLTAVILFVVGAVIILLIRKRTK